MYYKLYKSRVAQSKNVAVPLETKNIIAVCNFFPLLKIAFRASRSAFVFAVRHFNEPRFDNHGYASIFQKDFRGFLRPR